MQTCRSVDILRLSKDPVFVKLLPRKDVPLPAGYRPAILHAPSALLVVGKIEVGESFRIRPSARADIFLNLRLGRRREFLYLLF